MDDRYYVNCMKYLKIVVLLLVFGFLSSCSCNYDAEFESYTRIRIDQRYSIISCSCLDAIGEGGSSREFIIKSPEDLKSVLQELRIRIKIKTCGHRDTSIRLNAFRLLCSYLDAHFLLV